MRLRTRTLWLVAVLGLAGAMAPTIASSATTASVKALNEPSTLYSEERHYWAPTPVSVTASGSVTFSNESPSVYHGVVWRVTSATPAPLCEEGEKKVPVGLAKSDVSWSGSCNFTKPGAYNYYCSVHGPSMSGVVDVLGTLAATTEASTPIRQTSAALNGTVSPEGNAAEYHFEYGTSSVSEHTTSTVDIGVGDFEKDPASAAIVNLTPGTKYHVQLVVSYEAGKTTVLGGEQEFTTPVPTAPSATTEAATGLGEAEATLRGNVNPNGGEATEYSFEYGTTLSYGQSALFEALPADSSNHAVLLKLSGLSGSTEYHYRLVAKNKLGPADGVDRTFKTASPPPVSPPVSPPPVSPPPASPPTTTPPTGTGPATVLTSKLEAPPVLGPPLVAGSLKLTAPRHGFSLRVSLQVAQGGARGRLEVDLLARSASLAKAPGAGSKPVVAGRIVRQSLSTGKLSFSVVLTTRAKHALAHHRVLPLTVKVTLTPPGGETEAITRGVTLRS